MEHPNNIPIITLVDLPSLKGPTLVGVVERGSPFAWCSVQCSIIGGVLAPFIRFLLLGHLTTPTTHNTCLYKLSCITTRLQIGLGQHPLSRCTGSKVLFRSTGLAHYQMSAVVAIVITFNVHAPQFVYQ